MIQKILIANRGEIACRIIRTARRLGIKTVSVYSEADTNAAHVSMADEAIYIGHSPASQSYLSIDRIVEAVLSSGADAVHPGYGFLSENYQFAKRLQSEKIRFIGPSPEAIFSMGDKIEAKKLAQKAGVSTIPGYIGTIENTEEAKRIASDIGYPVMIKAAAGGGGKGMRAVYAEANVPQAYHSATNEATNSFRDGRIFIEKCIERPRHIEIQVLADQHGNVVCLGERECSIQRHHQKVIEEAPSSFIDNAIRQKMYAQCVALAKEVGYYSVGTVEFIVDNNRHFYFLEMNTRLQVEHPVTELITGLDLVEQMIHVANGKPLAFTQSDISLKGWAMEARIYAEDPTRGFLPSSGRISEYKEPEHSDNIRVDSGVYEGGQVSMFYDAMVAKLCSFGATRNDAIAHMQKALGDYYIRGISHNISFLEAIFSHDEFIKGNIHTGFIEECYPDGFSGAELTSERTRIFIAVAAYIYLKDAHRAVKISDQLSGRGRQIGNRWVVNIDGENFPVYVRENNNGYDIRCDLEFLHLSSNWVLGIRLFQGILNGETISVQIEYIPGGFYLTHRGTKVKAGVFTPRVAELAKFMPEKEDIRSSCEVKAPISGMLVAVNVKKEDIVKKGQELFILEAMKMENIICAERDAKVVNIHFTKGSNVSYGDVILEFAPDEG